MTPEIQHVPLLPDGVYELLKLAECYGVYRHPTRTWVVGDLYGKTVEVPQRYDLDGTPYADFARAIQHLVATRDPAAEVILEIKSLYDPHSPQ